MTRLWLARHGATPWSEAGRLQGGARVGLSSAGRRQAAALGELVRELHPTRLLVSPRVRAGETGRVVGAAAGIVPAVASELAEITYGRWTGATPGEVARLAPALAARWRATPWQTRLPGGASLPRLATVLTRLLARLAGLYPGQRIVCVTHGHVIRTLLVLGGLRPAEDFWSIDVAHGALVEIPFGSRPAGGA